ncbi:MAG: hypothetical protein ACYC0F_00815 [Rhodanobacter sp.]
MSTRGITAAAGIDPYDKLIDRVPSDNLRRVSIEEPGQAIAASTNFGHTAASLRRL